MNLRYEVKYTYNLRRNINTFKITETSKKLFLLNSQLHFNTVHHVQLVFTLHIKR